MLKTSSSETQTGTGGLDVYTPSPDRSPGRTQQYRQSAHVLISSVALTYFVDSSVR